MRRALISTLAPGPGGVSAMLRATLRLLAERGYESTVAWYEPYSYSPQLSVPSFRLGTRRVGEEARPVEGASRGLALGAWLPELEFTNYWPTRRWRELIADHDVHLVVSGNCLPGFPFARTGTPFLAWIASDWQGDRKDRVAKFPPQRRWLDRFVTGPAMRRIEPAILRRGRILALSGPTRRELDCVAGAAVSRVVLPCPIDLERYRPDARRVVQGRVGFVGRFDDPRKNLSLFLDGIAGARARDGSIHGLVIGGAPTAAIHGEVVSRGLDGAIEFLPYLEPARLAELLPTLDLVAISSHQEGLGIAFLEAMASGCPVVSTRCGGPEEFVLPGENGYLIDARGDALAEQVLRIVGDRGARERLSEGARRMVETSYSWSRVREIFERELSELERSMNDPGDGLPA